MPTKPTLIGHADHSQNLWMLSYVHPVTGDIVTTSGNPMPLPESKLTPIPTTAPKEFTRWKHFKGDTITVIRVARHSESGELLVIYTHLGEVWARPLSMWADEARPGVVRFVRAPEGEQPAKDAP